MFKKAILLTMILLLIPISAFASSIPSSIEGAIKEDLKNQKTELDILIKNSKNNSIVNKGTDQKTELGDGYSVYMINTANHVKNDVYNKSSSLDNFLQFNGYLFVIESNNRSKAIAFADRAPDYNEITQFSTDTDFANQIKKAKSLIGYNKDSKVLYDGANQIVALVTKKDTVEKVALLKDSMLNNMNAFDVFNSEEFIAKIISSQEQRSKIAAISNEPVSGGGVTNLPINNESSLRIKPVIVVTSIFLLGFIVFYFNKK
ncbi:hypothetical protein PQ460_02700 [Paenibacillus sp. KACC 21273]|uniref:hypothetical protein n=1 Tax=Paenibacillus sp. KACC 21273 TaxID=3025665 RepID=UPI00236631E3|nr:hypothetical protein [Paenibacillus sp. KACC 21273]WDF51388.1 hypothetical protein PQ460_02700 [Paenibacillus sp. KACC 21273]